MTFAHEYHSSELANVPGASIPWPYGGKVRQISVDLDMPKLQAHGTLAE